MKPRIIILLILMAVNHNCIAQRVPGLRFLGRVFGRSYPKPVVVPRMDAYNIVRSFNVEAKSLPKRWQVVSYNGDAYLLEEPQSIFKYEENSIYDIVNKLRDEMAFEEAKREALRAKNYELKAPEESYSSFQKLQSFLQSVGYSDVVPDGIVGPKTRAAIKKAFGFDPKGMDEEKIIMKIEARMKPSKKKSEILYSITLIRQGEPPIVREDLNASRANAEIRKIQKDLNCGLSETCFGVSELGASISLECTDQKGNGVSLKLSTSGSLELGVKNSLGRFESISVDKDRKVQINTAFSQ